MISHKSTNLRLVTDRSEDATLTSEENIRSPPCQSP